MKSTRGCSAILPSHRLVTSESDAVIDFLPLGIVFQNKEGKILTANPAAERILGLSLDQMQGVKSTDPRWQAIREDGSPFPGEDHPAMVSLQTGLPVKNVKMGVFNPAIEDFTWIDISAFPAKSETADPTSGVYTIFEDITSLTKAEDGQRVAKVKFETEEKERRRLEHLIFGAKIGTFEWNVQTGEGVINDQWASIVGCTLDELKPWNAETWSTRVHPDDLFVAQEKLEKHFQGKTDFYSHDSRIRHKDGHWVWIHSMGMVISRGPDGKPLKMYGGMLDITERKRAQEGAGGVWPHWRGATAPCIRRSATAFTFLTSRGIWWK